MGKLNLILKIISRKIYKIELDKLYQKLDQICSDQVHFNQ